MEDMNFGCAFPATSCFGRAVAAGERNRPLARTFVGKKPVIRRVFLVLVEDIYYPPISYPLYHILLMTLDDNE